MNIKIYILSLVAFAILFSCGTSEKKYEFQNSETGIPHYFIEKVDTGRFVKDSDFVVLDFDAKLLRTDTTLFNSKRDYPSERVIFIKNIKKAEGKSFEDALKLMRVGDSICFKINAKAFYAFTLKSRAPSFIVSIDTLVFNARLKAIKNKEMVIADMEKLAEKKKSEEKMLMEEFVAKNYPDAKPYENGLYVIETKKGSDDKVLENDFVSIHYVGKLIDGFQFYSSIEKEKVFSFDVGDQKVITAFSESVKHLSVGSKAVVIVPSSLAYGEEGYGSLIPPYSTLIFEIEVLATTHFKK